jgi:hypothetical protein
VSRKPVKRYTEQTIQPIETLYGGRHYRSRLEARWAVFFDAVGVKYDYEPEGFDLGQHRWYLPDFCLGRVWVEIKPYTDKNNEFNPKLSALSKVSFPVLHVRGMPRPGDYAISLYFDGERTTGDAGMHFTMLEHEPTHELIGLGLHDGEDRCTPLQNIGDHALDPGGADTVITALCDHDKLYNAFVKATMERFDRRR